MQCLDKPNHQRMQEHDEANLIEKSQYYGCYLSNKAEFAKEVIAAGSTKREQDESKRQRFYDFCGGIC